MDNDSPAARVERSFWTVWYYISGAFNRFFRPEPTNIVRDDPSSSQESTADSEPAHCGHAEGDTSRRDFEEELPPATVSGLSLSRPLVAWELCTTEIDLGPAEESMQLYRDNDSEFTDEGEGMREQQFFQERNDDAGLLSTEDAKEEQEEESKVWKLYSPGQDERQENDEYEEHMNATSLRLAGDAVAEDVEGRGRIASAEEETETAITTDDQQKMDETMTKIQVKEEEDKKMHSEDEDDLEAGENEPQVCTITYLNQKEEDEMHIEEEGVQRDEVDTVVTHEDVEDSDGLSLLVKEIENKSDEDTKQAENQPSVSEESDDFRDLKADPSFTSLHAELQMAQDKSNIVSEDELIVGQEHVTAQRITSDEVDYVKEKENEKERGAVIEEENVNEAANNQTTDEVPEQENNTESVMEDQQEEDIATGHVTCSEEVVQSPEAELNTVEFTDTKVQTKTRETDDGETEGHAEVMDGKCDIATADISIDQRLFDKDQMEAERPSSEVCNKESFIEDACKITSVTVKPEGETEQEMSGEFKNIPAGVCEGRLVVLRELHSPTCEETQEGVPGYNNEPGPDENTTQRFLEVGDYEEVQYMQLPEEVESKELESLQNSGCSSGVDYLLETEHMEEEQDSTEDIKNSLDLDVEEHAGVVLLTDAGLPQETKTSLGESVNQESGHSFEVEEEKFLVDSMKTGTEHSEEESEIHVGLTDENDKKSEELHSVTEKVLVEFQTDERLCDFKEADAAAIGLETTGTVAAEKDEILKFLDFEVQRMTEMSFFQEFEDALNSEQNNNRTPDLHEDFTESAFLKQSVETEPKLLGDTTVDMEDAGIDMEETGYGVKEAVEGDVHNIEVENLNLQVKEIAADLNTESSEKEHVLTTESELLEKQNQPSEETLEISTEETGAAVESITSDSRPKLIVVSGEETVKHVTEGGYAKETVSPISGCQDVIEDEILDLWIETVLSEDTEGIKQQEGPESGQEMDTEIEPSNEEQNEISPEKDKEQLEESNTEESDLVSDTDISSSTAESGFLDQGSTGSFQAIYDMLANMSESADISEPSTQQLNFTFQDMLMEETAETRQSYVKEEESVTETGFHPDSGVTLLEARHQDTDISQEKTDEETGPQKDTDAEITNIMRSTEWKEPKEAGVKSVTEISTLFKVEETKVEDEPLDITVSDSLEEIAHTRSNSEAFLEEGIVSTESGSPCGTCTESLSLENLQTTFSKDITDSLPGLNRAEIAQQPTTDSEYQMELDASVLDFTAQKSRIAVKNPHVRPPKDPRSLLHMPSLDPTPSSHLPVKVPPGMPLGGLGIGIKLPGLGAGFPVLKKTQRVVKDENSQDASSQEPETKPEVKTETPKEDETQHKPKWMPPRHPGFGNPLMSELKTKLKKTSKE